MKKRERPFNIETKTLTRRSLLDWLGKSAVIALGGNVLLACDTDPEDLESDDPFDTSNDTEADGGHGDSGSSGDTDEATCLTDSELPFEPGSRTLEIFDNWGERTVDKQDLAGILKDWRLTINGLVDSPTTLTFTDLLALERQDQITDFHCVEGWSIHDVPWNGVHLRTLFDLVTPQSTATHITFHTIDDKYNGSLPLAVALEPKTLLAFGIGCQTLPLEHGFPLRGVVPRMWGYKSSKYIYRMELTDEATLSYWEKAGYPYDGKVSEERLRPGKY